MCVRVHACVRVCTISHIIKTWRTVANPGNFFARGLACCNCLVQVMVCPAVHAPVALSIWVYKRKHAFCSAICRSIASEPWRQSTRLLCICYSAVCEIGHDCFIFRPTTHALLFADLSAALPFHASVFPAFTYSVFRGADGVTRQLRGLV